MRGMLPELPSPRPLASMLPAMLQGDDFCVRFTEGLDPVLAPVFSTVDNLDAYTDPLTTPADFLTWLAGWFGFELDDTWPESRRRALVSSAVEVLRGRGTVAGMRRLVLLFAGVEAVVEDGGGTWATLDPGAALPGEARSDVVVRLPARQSATVDVAKLTRFARSMVPGHVAVRVVLDERLG